MHLAYNLETKNLTRNLKCYAISKTSLLSARMTQVRREGARQHGMGCMVKISGGVGKERSKWVKSSYALLCSLTHETRAEAKPASLAIRRHLRGHSPVAIFCDLRSKLPAKGREAQKEHHIMRCSDGECRSVFVSHSLPHLKNERAQSNCRVGFWT